MSPFSTLKPGGRLRPRSKKREQIAKDFAPIREAAFERDGHACQFPWRIGRDCVPCYGQLHPHHIVPTGRDSTLRLVLSNIVSLCDRHHAEVHGHPLESAAVGLLLSVPPGGL